MKICYIENNECISKNIYIFFFATKAFEKNIDKTTKKTLYIFMKACYNIKCKLKKH